MSKKKQKKLVAAEVAEQMLENLDDIDWGYENGMGVCHMRLSAQQVIRWCEAMDWPIPEGTIEHARDAEAP